MRPMTEAVGPDKAGPVEEEARLARAAASGDGSAFATLYERYAQRAYNLSFRLCDSEEDAADAVQEAFLSVVRRLPQIEDPDFAFGSYLFTATRNATYDILRRAQRTRPSDSIPEGAVPLGAGAGGLGLDPGDPDEDPDRRQLLAAQREEIRAANARLPERQREALALRELEDLSYDEIAAQLEMNRNSVAQLISRARINLRDELRGSALASVAAASPECERALPLLAMRDDRQLEPGSADAGWLDAHLAGCDRCRVAEQAMQEAGASYRLWIPLALAPFLFRETMARAAELTGSDWSAATADRDGAAPDPASVPGMPPAYLAAAGEAGASGATAERRRRRRRAAALAALALLLLGGGVAALAAAGGEEPELMPTVPAAEAEPAPPAAAPAPERETRAKKKEKARAGDPATPAETTAATPAPAPPQTEATPAPAAPGSKKSPQVHVAPAPGGQQGGVEESEATETEPEPPPASAPETTPPTQLPPAEEPVEEPPPREEEPVPGGPNLPPPAP